MTRLQDWFYKYNAWSFTKHNLWRQCKRAYYYQYIGPALQNIKYSERQQLKQLKRLDSRFVLQGKLVHEVLENQLEQHHRGLDVSEDRAKEQYVKSVEKYRQDAQNALVEYFNGDTISEAFFDRIRENGLDQISLFFGVIWLQLVHSHYLRHEKFDRFSISKVEAIVKVDYVSKYQNGEIAISDWKTGIENEEYENELQIAAYVLWATQFYKVPPDKIRSELVYLTTGSIKSYNFSVEQLKEVEQLIVSDFKEMNKSYEIDYFEPTPTPRQCLSCHFASICPHSLANQPISR